MAYGTAGYLFAQGTAAVAGNPVPRSQIKLNQTAAFAELKKIALEKGDGCRLLRIYWYDGSAAGRLSTDQSALAFTDDIKLRLGQISAGQQKDVDSLIVTDLIELARNQAISDALLVSGDEDVKNRCPDQIGRASYVRSAFIVLLPMKT